MVSGISYNNIKVAVRKIRLKFEKKRDFRGGGNKTLWERTLRRRGCGLIVNAEE